MQAVSTPVTQTSADAPNQPIADPRGGGLIQQDNQTTTQEVRPTWLPEKFKSPEEMAKSYSELEKRFGQPKQDATKTEQPQDATQQPVNGFQKYSDEYFSSGKLSDETYSELTAKGIPKEYVDQYMKGFEATQEAQSQAIISDVGGEEQFKAMSTWASEALSESELEAYNRAVSSGNKDEASFAVKGIYARYRAGAGGLEPRLLAGDTSVSGPSDVYRSTAEVVEAMKNPKYKADKAYRKDVEEKLNRSNVFN
jgi:hypothetical protein